MDLPDMERTVARLAPLFPALFEGLEHGVAVSKGLFDEWGREHDPYVFAINARFHAIPVIDARGQALDGYARTEAPNCGIHLTFGGYRLRCWKTTDGELPHPSSSTARLRFLRQLPLNLPLFGFGTGHDDYGNLVIQWEADPVTGIVDLTLVCPKPGKDGPDSIETYWSFPVPHPSRTMACPPAASAFAADVEDLEFIRTKAPDRLRESLG